MLPVILLMVMSQNVMGQLNGTYSIGAAGVVIGETGNYATFSEAITALNNNGVTGPCTFYFTTNGTYTETNDVALGCTGTSATNTITFKPYTGIVCTLSLTLTANIGGASIDGFIAIGSPTQLNTNLVSTNYITIDGSNTIGGTTKDLTISGATTSNTKSVIRIFGNNDFITIKNCIINNNCTSASSTAPINVTNWFAVSNFTPDNLTIQNNTLNSIAANGSIGIQLSISTGTPTTGMTGIVIQNNIIFARASRAIFTNYVNDATISGNSISLDQQASGLNGAGIALLSGTAAAGTFNIFNNTFTKLATVNTGAAGASIGIIGIENQLSTPKIVNIYNNVIRGFQTTAAVTNVRIYGIRHTGSSTTNIYNNSIYFPDLTNMTTFGSSFIAGIAFATAATTEAAPSGVMNVKNNAIFMDESTMKVYAIRRPGTGGTFTSDNNVLYVNPSNTSGNIGIFNTTDYNTLAVWQSNSSQDAASFNVNPNYTSTSNLQITALNGRNGITIAGITTDITGLTRLSPPTIGAYEAPVNGWWKALPSDDEWGIGNNWVGESVPTTNVVIPSTSSVMPTLLANTTISSLNNNGRITVNGANDLSVTGNIINSGSITSTSGRIILNGSTAQSVVLNGNISVQDLTLNNATGATLSGSGFLNVTGTVNITTGALASAGRLTLKSSSPTSTARIATVAANAITGNVNVERYIGGSGSAFPGSGNSKRGFRFIGHPFNASIGLSQINGSGEFSISGLSGATNGFQATTTNNPSAFWYDPTVLTAGANTTVGSGGGAAADAGWKPFTKTDGLLANAWGVGQGIRFLFRGDQTQGLTSNTDYIMTNATATMIGTLNTGSVIVNLTSNASNPKGFNVIGNPLPSPVDLSLTTSRTNMGANFWVFDPSMGNRGGYSAAKPFTSSYIIPLSGAFVAEVTTLGNASSLTFPEASKASTPTDNLLRTSSQDNYVKFRLEGGNMFWDELNIMLGNQYKAATEYVDGAKLINSDVNFYSITNDNNRLSLDYRKLIEGEVIPLGLETNLARNFTIKVTDVKLDAGVNLYLVDKFLNTQTKLESGATYDFVTTSNVASQGESRFEIGMKQIPIPIISNSLEIKISPNPVKDQMYINYNNPEQGNAVARITNGVGQVVKTIQLGKQQQGNEKVSMKGLLNGVYNVELTIGKERITKQVVKH